MKNEEDEELERIKAGEADRDDETRNPKKHEKSALNKPIELIHATFKEVIQKTRCSRRCCPAKGDWGNSYPFSRPSLSL